MKFKAIVQYEVEVEANNTKIAESVILSNPPYMDIGGAGIECGLYSIKSKNGIKIIQLLEENKKKVVKKKVG